MGYKSNYCAKDSTTNYELKKHVATIHSTNKLSLLQRKIANALLFNAYEELLEKNEHQIHIKTLCELIGYSSNDHKTIKKALVNLLSTVIEWNLVDDSFNVEGGIWNASSIIADASIDGAICSYSYSNKMRQLLYRPEIYGRLNLIVQAKFKSNYGLALYENCIRYQDIQQTPWINLLTFRKLMGVEENQYHVFRDFKRRVLDKAITEVNEYSPITITPVYKKQGCTVQAIKFQIVKSDKAQDRLSSPSSDIVPDNLIIQLCKRFGVSDQKAAEIIDLYEEQYILEKMSLIESSSSYKSGKIINLAKYLEDALSKNYQQPLSSAKITTDRRTLDEQKKLNEKKSSSESTMLEREYSKYKLDLYCEWVAQRVDKEIIYNKFNEYLNDLDNPIKAFIKAYCNSDVRKPPTSLYFIKFIEQYYAEVKEQCVSIKEFIVSD